MNYITQNNFNNISTNHFNCNVIYIISTYKPTNILINLVKLLDSKKNLCIIVDDRNKEAKYKNIFDELNNNKCIILKHYFNKGKGAALKTSFEWILLNNLKPIGVVTLDADGQHKIDDAQIIAKSLLENPNCLILGVRNFSNKIPLRSKIGNQTTRFIFKILIGESISDTQTGLRGIPFKNLEQLIKIKPNRYEYELEMLIQIKKMVKNI